MIEWIRRLCGLGTVAPSELAKPDPRQWPRTVCRAVEPCLEAGDVVCLWRDNPYKGVLRAGCGYMVLATTGLSIQLRADNNTIGWFWLKYFVHGAPDPGVSRRYGKSRKERKLDRLKMNNDYAEEYEMILKSQDLIGE